MASASYDKSSWKYNHTDTDMFWVNHTDTYTDTDTDMVLLNQIHTDTDIERTNLFQLIPIPGVLTDIIPI